jgi:hypothetical protein
MFVECFRQGEVLTHQPALTLLPAVLPATSSSQLHY